MPINLEVNGVEYTNFTRATCTVALDSLANDFSFEAVMPAGQQLPIKGGQSCRVVVDGVLQVTGWIESIGGSCSAQEHSISISGRDRTADLIDSDIDVMDDIRGTAVSLQKIISLVVAHIGSDLKVIDNAKPALFNVAEDIVVPKPGDNAFAFVEGYAQKRQVLLTSNADGDITITKSEPTQSAGVLQNAVAGIDNNILSSAWSFTGTDLFNKYIQKGQQDPQALDMGGASSADGVVSQKGMETDPAVRKGRQRVDVADKGFSTAQLKTRAAWSKKIRKARSVAYACTVQGFRNSGGELWAVNTLVPVYDEFADIDRPLLLNSITFAQDNGGSVASLGFVEADAYALKASEPRPVGTNQDAFILGAG